MTSRATLSLVLSPRPDDAPMDDENEPLPETIAGCDEEIEDLEETVDDITSQIEMADKGLTRQGDYEDWRHRAIGALHAHKKELYQVYRQKNRLEHEARIRARNEEWDAQRRAKQAEHDVKMAVLRPSGLPKDPHTAALLLTLAEQTEANRQAEHARKMERIKASTDRNLEIFNRFKVWLREHYPEAWERGLAECIQPAQAEMDKEEADA